MFSMQWCQIYLSVAGLVYKSCQVLHSESTPCFAADREPQPGFPCSTQSCSASSHCNGTGYWNLSSLFQLFLTSLFKPDLNLKRNESTWAFFLILLSLWTWKARAVGKLWPAVFLFVHISLCCRHWWLFLFTGEWNIPTVVMCKK